MPSRRSVLQFIGIAPFVKPTISDAPQIVDGLPIDFEIAETVAPGSVGGNEIVTADELAGEILRFWKTSDREIIALSVYNDNEYSDDA